MDVSGRSAAAGFFPSVDRWSPGWHTSLGHRRVVVGNYKVVYRVLEEEEVRIVDVFDSRQDRTR